MHPFHAITLAHEHVADLASTADRRRLARHARRFRRGGARSPAPPAVADDDAVVLTFLATAADERRPAA